MNATASTLPLKGARKKPEPKPRTEGVMRRKKRSHFYARLYAPDSKRATYVSTGATTTDAATKMLPHLRAELVRHSEPKAPALVIEQPSLLNVPPNAPLQ